MESSNQCDLKQHANIPLDIIKSIIKHCTSHTVSEDICQVIADQFNYELTEIIKVSADYMNHCGRLKFTAEDFNKGVLFCGKEIHMQNKWLPTSKEMAKKRKINISCSQQQQNTCIENLFVNIEEKWLNNDSPLSRTQPKNLQNELQVYFNVITKTLLTQNEDICYVILNDFKTNKNIFHLVPHFVDFFCSNVDKLKCDFLKTSLLLKSIESLLSNPYLYFGQKSFLNQLSITLLKFLGTKLPYVNEGKDCWLLKDTAANTLAHIFNRSKSQQLFFEITHYIDHILCNLENSLISHYGALAALNSVGVPAILLMIPSYIRMYNTYAKSVCASNSQERNHICMVQGQIIHSHYLLVTHYFKYEFKKPKFNLQHYLHSNIHLPNILKDNKVFPILLQTNFTSYFGDALVPHFPLLNFVSYSTYIKKKNIGTTKSRKSHFKKYDKSQDNTTEHVHSSLNQVFDSVTLKRQKIITFKKIILK